MKTGSFLGLSLAALAASVITATSVLGAPTNVSTRAPNAALPETQPGGCAWRHRVNGWETVDDYHIIVRQSQSKRFLVTFTGPCREQRWSHAIKVVRGFGSCLSSGDWVQFVDSPHGFWSRHNRPFLGQTCVISRVDRIVPTTQSN